MFDAEVRRMMAVYKVQMTIRCHRKEFVEKLAQEVEEVAANGDLKN